VKVPRWIRDGESSAQSSTSSPDPPWATLAERTLQWPTYTMDELLIKTTCHTCSEKSEVAACEQWVVVLKVVHDVITISSCGLGHRRLGDTVLCGIDQSIESQIIVSQMVRSLFIGVALRVCTLTRAKS
jgi:hypothetical protein